MMEHGSVSMYIMVPDCAVTCGLPGYDRFIFDVSKSINRILCAKIIPSAFPLRVLRIEIEDRV